MFELYQDYLASQGIEKERIVSINLEDGNYRMLRDPQRLYDYIENLLIAGRMNYVFLDEIQQVPDFQRAALYMNYLTNSSFPGTLRRELVSLESIHDHNPKYLLTMDFVPMVSHNGIKQMNALDWLLK